MKLFLAPHNDDETLFGAFTIMREKPHVLLVYDSVVQKSRGLGIMRKDRRMESMEAMCCLDQSLFLIFGFVSDEHLNEEKVRRVLMANSDYEHVFAPAIEEGGHEQHNLVGRIADELWPRKVTHYLTYTRHGGKSRSKNEVPIEDPGWIIRKHRALACYTSQITVREAGCWPHFMEDLHEYYADPK